MEYQDLNATAEEDGEESPPVATSKRKLRDLKERITKKHLWVFRVTWRWKRFIGNRDFQNNRWLFGAHDSLNRIDCIQHSRHNRLRQELQHINATEFPAKIIWRGKDDKSAETAQKRYDNWVSEDVLSLPSRSSEYIHIIRVSCDWIVDEMTLFLSKF